MSKLTPYALSSVALVSLIIVVYSALQKANSVEKKSKLKEIQDVSSKQSSNNDQVSIKRKNSGINLRSVLVTSTSDHSELINIVSRAAINNEYCFRCFETALLILRIAQSLEPKLNNNIPAVSNFYDLLSAVESFGLNTASFVGKKQVVVIEGLKGSGKTTVMNGIVNATPLINLYTSAYKDCLDFVSGIFEDMQTPFAQAFVFALNYITAYEILQDDRSHTIVVEKYHHSFCVNNICNRMVSEEEIKGLNSSVFEWPFDLPIPDLVIYLQVTTDTRLTRLHLQDAGITVAYGESAFDTDSQFGSFILNRSSSREVTRDAKAHLVYSLIRGPFTACIDANGDPEIILNTAFSALQHYKIDWNNNYLSTNSEDMSTITTVVREDSDNQEESTNLRSLMSKRLSYGAYGVFSKI
eukprot:gene7002-9567_t